MSEGALHYPFIKVVEVIPDLNGPRYIGALPIMVLAATIEEALPGK